VLIFHLRAAGYVPHAIQRVVHHMTLYGCAEPGSATDLAWWVFGLYSTMLTVDYMWRSLSKQFLSVFVMQQENKSLGRL